MLHARTAPALWAWLLGLGVGVTLLSSFSLAAESYAIIDLHPSGSFTHSFGYAVSGSQQVGYSYSTGFLDSHALFWSDPAASAVDLNPSGFRYCSAQGTNGRQQVGYGGGPAIGNTTHALLWSGSAASVIDLNPSGFDVSSAWAIGGNQQVGHGSGPATRKAIHALLWSGTAASAVDLNPGGFATSFAYGTNGSQQVGYGSITEDRAHALLWSGTATSAIDLNPRGFTKSRALAIGGTQQVGYGYGPASGLCDHALLWSGTPESVVDLNPSGFGGSYAYGTNGAQQVGYGGGRDMHDHALLWSGTADRYIDLSTFLPSDWTDSRALAIDLQGNIVGYATDALGNYHAVLWASSGVPEPTAGCLSLLIMGMIVLRRPTQRRS